MHPVNRDTWNTNHFTGKGINFLEGIFFGHLKVFFQPGLWI